MFRFIFLLSVIFLAGADAPPKSLVLDKAQECLSYIDKNVKDYSAVLIKQERINGVLTQTQHLFIKVRHVPFSVYVKFLQPKDIAGQESIYVSGRNGGNLLAHGVGIKKFLGTLILNPTSRLAMEGQKYPITEIGMRRLVETTLDVGSRELEDKDAEISVSEHIKFEGKDCSYIQVSHPKKKDGLRYHIVKVWIDHELKVPIKCETYDWDEQLSESYLYSEIKLNVNLTDKDFDTRNPRYRFR